MGSERKFALERGQDLNLRPPGYQQGEPCLIQSDPSPPVSIHRDLHATGVSSVPAGAAPSRSILVTDLVTDLRKVLSVPGERGHTGGGARPGRAVVPGLIDVDVLGDTRLIGASVLGRPRQVATSSSECLPRSAQSGIAVVARTRGLVGATSRRAALPRWRPGIVPGRPLLPGLTVRSVPAAVITADRVWADLDLPNQRPLDSLADPTTGYRHGVLGGKTPEAVRGAGYASAWLAMA